MARRFRRLSITAGFRKFSITAGIVGLLAAGALALAADASAHVVSLSGSATCLANGKYKITWQGTTTSVPANQTGMVFETSPQMKLLIMSLPPNDGFTTTTTEPGNATTAHASVLVIWHGPGVPPFKGVAAADVALPGTCGAPPPPPPPIAAVAPSATPPTCFTAGHLVIPTQPTGLRLEGGSNGDGPGAYHLVVRYNKARFTLVGPSSFDITVRPQLTGCTTTPPTSPTTTPPTSPTTTSTSPCPTTGCTTPTTVSTSPCPVTGCISGTSASTSRCPVTGCSSATSTSRCPVTGCTTTSGILPIVVQDGSSASALDNDTSGTLANTGSETGAEITIALAAISLGAFALQIGRRRHQH